MAPASPNEKADQLEALARARFPEPALTTAEIRLVRAVPKGEFAACGPNADYDSPVNDPATAGKWGADREIRAELIRWLCVDRQARDLVDPQGILALGAKVRGPLNLTYVSIPFGLLLFHCHIEGPVLLLVGELAELGLQGCRTGPVYADRARVKGSVFLRNGFTAKGAVRLQGAQIGGDLDCNGGTFDNPPRARVAGSGVALLADRAVIKGGVFLSNYVAGKSEPLRFVAKGEVRLIGAEIGGNLECDGSRFENPPLPGLEGGGAALFADSVVVGGNVYLRNGFAANGMVRLPGAQIGATLDCSRSTFENPPQKEVKGSGWALNGDRAEVKGSVFLSDGFTAKGAVRLQEAQISGDMDCSGGAFGGGVIAQSASVKGVMWWQQIAEPTHTRLDLIGTSVDTLVDDAASWPAYGNLRLDGFVYRRFSGKAPTDAARRLEWLARMDSFSPQPYRQLAKVLSESGDEGGAQNVLIEMERRRRLADPWFERPWDWLAWATIRYGYRPVWALGGLGVMTGLGWIIYRRALLARTMAPTDKEAYLAYRTNDAPPAGYVAFSPLIYAVENSLPLVKLGQADRWQPEPNKQAEGRHVGGWLCRLIHWIASREFVERIGWLQASLRWVLRCLAGLSRWTTLPRFLHWFLWAQILLGWVLATLFAAGVTGIVRKD